MAKKQSIGQIYSQDKNGSENIEYTPDNQALIDDLKTLFCFDEFGTYIKINYNYPVL